MTTNWYWRRIRKNLNKVLDACQDILPANRAAVYDHLKNFILTPIDRALAGLRDCRQWEWISWDEHPVFSKFKDYVLTEEKRLKTTLRRLSYNITQDNTLHILTRGGRPEKVCMTPLSFTPSYSIRCSFVMQVCIALALLAVRARIVDGRCRENLISVPR